MFTRALGFIATAALLASYTAQAAFNPSGPNVMYYWGQNSVGGGSSQASLATYCNSGQVDGLLISFLNVFNVGGQPGLNLANTCETTFPGTSLLNCPEIGNDIKTCQSKGVKIILSLGGAAGSYGFSSDADGKTFAQTIWDMFGGGSAQYRPFGDAQIDGVDLDIEGGSSTGYAAFVTAVRQKFASHSGFLVGAAPQCPFPDAVLGSVIDAVGFDYVNVQFYNNYCSATGNSFNYDTWAKWATTTSPNKNVRVYFTVPGSQSAAGSGYTPINTIQSIVPQLASQYPNTFGGVSVWDAAQAWNNGNFASTLYTTVKGQTSGGGGGTNPSPTIAPTGTSTTASTKPTTTATTTTSAGGAVPTGGSCVSAGAACSSEGKYQCTAGGAYAVCNHGEWSVTACPSGTECISTSDGSSIYCGYVTGSGNTCTAPSSAQLLIKTLNHGGAVPKAYSLSQVEAQLTVQSVTSEGFEAVINARRTNATPFSNTVTFEFTAPANVKFTSVESGTVRQVGNNVRIQAQNPYNKSMAVVLPIKGTVNTGVFVAPLPASMRIK
ncbi:chitinase 2 [Mycotypha africana]|uniref:chitinase 2 n=1 Tax=Mycotypha africana TaxID=64632 RepID=UPI00230181A0|nr:chitinase 2 [Mycotypha africana]KAI8979609.1 chitinase 2 [Mycotypha africana]